MSENGLTAKERVVNRHKDDKQISIGQENTLTIPRFSQQLDLTDTLKDFDSDSGVSSLRQLRGKVATSVSGTNLASDDELEDEDDLSVRKTSSSLTTSDFQDRRESDVSLSTNFTVNKTSNEFQLSSKTSSRASGINSLHVISPATAASTKKSSAIPVPSVENKEKTGMRKLIHKIFKSSSSSNPTKATGNTRTSGHDSPKLNIDHQRESAYPPLSPLPITQGPVRLLVLRHGERLDRYYSSQWLRQAFDKNGNFCRFSPILPETLPFRASIRDFDLDPPLTYKGLKDSYHTGTVLRDKSIHISYCYSSPALRCVQTASKILEGLQIQNKIKIRIEPGLFECTGWYTANETSNVLTMPRFMTKKELLENKYPIEKQYHEQMTLGDISKLETELEFYQRSHTVTSSILKMHETDYITSLQQGQANVQQSVHILFIAHAPNLETCTRKLCGGKFRPDTLPHVIRNVDFLTMTVIEKTDNNADKWIFRRSSFYGDEF